jgi:hypothetical protein
MRYAVDVMDQSGSLLNDKCRLISETPILVPNVGEQLMAPEAGLLDVMERTFYYRLEEVCVELRCKESTREPKRH